VRGRDFSYSTLATLAALTLTRPRQCLGWERSLSRHIWIKIAPYHGPRRGSVGSGRTLLQPTIADPKSPAPETPNFASPPFFPAKPLLGSLQSVEISCRSAWFRD